MSDPLERFRPTSDALTRSVLDRLIDPNPDLAVDPARPIGAQVTEVRENLRRDLEILLNTRRRPVSPPKELADLGGSLVEYGVDGFFLTTLVTDLQRKEFATALEIRIRQFEPRLEDVRVAVVPNRNPSERALKLRIEASYTLQPGMPPVAFETAIDPSTQRISVEAPRG